MQEKGITKVHDGVTMFPEAEDSLLQVDTERVLPPYWDGHYSSTWRYAGNERYASQEDWVGDAPKAYHFSEAELASTYQRQAAGNPSPYASDSVVGGPSILGR